MLEGDQTLRPFQHQTALGAGEPTEEREEDAPSLRTIKQKNRVVQEYAEELERAMRMETRDLIEKFSADDPVIAWAAMDMAALLLVMRLADAHEDPADMFGQMMVILINEADRRGWVRDASEDCDGPACAPSEPETVH